MIRFSWVLILVLECCFVSTIVYADPLCTCQNINKIQKAALNVQGLTQCVNDLTNEINKSEEPKEAIAKCKLERDSIADRLNNIQKKQESTYEPLIVDFNDYDDFFFKFTVGYEYVSVNKLFDKGFPRIGLLIYQKYSNRFNTFGKFLLTSSAEEDVSTGAEFSGMGEEVDRALDIDIQAFYSLGTKSISLEHNTRKIKEEFGFTAVIGGRKTDQSTKIDGRYYLGIREAFNPQIYIDLLFGKTETRLSRRCELRGQMPIYKLGFGERVYLGGVANFAIGNSRKDTLEKDVIRVYITWDIANVGNIFK